MSPATLTKKIEYLEHRIASLEQYLPARQIRHSQLDPDAWVKSRGVLSSKTVRGMLAHVKKSRKEWTARIDKLRTFGKE